jgi:hypothetical protein
MVKDLNEAPSAVAVSRYCHSRYTNTANKHRDHHWILSAPFDKHPALKASYRLIVIDICVVNTLVE